MGLCKVLFLFIIIICTTHSFNLVEGTRKSSARNFLRLFQNCLVRLSGNFKIDTEADVRYASYFGKTKTSIILETIGKSPTSHDDSWTKKWNDNGEGQGMIRKNLNCSVQIYFIDGIVGETGDFLSMHKILGNMVVNNENPEYIIFIKEHKGKEKSWEFIQSETGFYSNLYRLTLTSKFFVVDGKKKMIHLVCMHCRGTIANQLKIINPKDEAMESLQDLNKLWDKTHQNLHGRTVEGFIVKRRAEEELSNFKNHDCGLYKAGLKTIENICAQLVISKSLNFTPYTTSQDFRVYGQVKSGVMSYSGYNDQLFLNPTSTSKYEWATTGEYFEPFIYITVVDKDALNISALWRTFDLETWLAIILIFILLASLFAIMSSSRFEVIASRINHLRFTFVLFTAILLEQSQLTIWKVKMRINRVSKIILVVWIVVSIIISSLYKGTIFSTLCTSIPPSTPHTIKDLVESPYFLMTSTSYYWQGNAYSTLDGILNEMTSRQAGRDYPMFYKELKDNVHFVVADYSEIVKAHKASSQLLVINNHHQDGNNNRNNYEYRDSTTKETTEVALQGLTRHKIANMPLFQNVTLPNNFAIIGSEFDVDTLMKLLETFTTSFVLKSSTVNTLLNRLPFIIRRNFFFKKFQPQLASLYESGIYSRWRAMKEIDVVCTEFKNVHKAMGEENHRYNYLALLFSGMKIIENNLTLQPRPLSFDIFDSAFVFYVLCCVGSFSVFTSEWFFFLFCKFFLKIDQNMVGHLRM